MRRRSATNGASAFTATTERARGRRVGRLIGVRALVIGAGIGGVAAALALARRGAAVTVLERAEAPGEVGAGIQISPNGMRVLDALGCGVAVRDAGLRAGSIVMRDHAGGRPILTMEFDAEGFHFLHRPRLLKVLLDAAGAADATVRWGAAAGPIDDGAEPRVASRGDQIAADIVVAADGLASKARALLNGEKHAFFTGQVAWRAVIGGEGPARADLMLGPGRHLVSYPLSGGLRNVVAVEEARDWTAEGWRQEGDPEELRARFADFVEARDWLGQVRTVHRWGLFRHPVARRWHGRRMALLGDAAHPTLPFLAQGANLALEDAWVLAACLDRAAPERALPRYQAARRRRVALAVRAAGAQARLYHLSNPVLRQAAHGVLRATERLRPGMAIRRFDWLYGHDVTTL